MDCPDKRPSSIRRGEEMTADLQRYERRMRAQLTTVVTLPTESLANIPSLDALTDEEREQVDQVPPTTARNAANGHVEPVTAMVTSARPGFVSLGMSRSSGRVAFRLARTGAVRRR